MNGHVKQECLDPDCGGMCNYCCLFCCKVCRGAEGSLPHECPGVSMTAEQMDAVYAGTLDYRSGQWTKREPVLMGDVVSMQLTPEGFIVKPDQTPTVTVPPETPSRIFDL